MAYRSLGSLTLDLVAKTGGYTQGMKKAERASDNFQSKTRAHYKRVGVALKQLGVAATAAFAVLGRTAYKALQDIDKMAKTARQIGVASDEMAGLKLAAELGGASLEDLNTALIRLAANAAKNHKAFAQLGIAVKNPQGELKSTRELLSELANKFAAMPDGVEKTAFATDLLGRSGAKLISMLDGGSAALDDNIAKTRQWGTAVGADAAHAAEKFNDQMRMMRERASGIATEFTVALLPDLGAVADAFTHTGESMSAATPIAEVFGKAIRSIAFALTVIAGSAKVAGTAIGETFGAAVTESLKESLDKAKRTAAYWKGEIKQLNDMLTDFAAAGATEEDTANIRKTLSLYQKAFDTATASANSYKAAIEAGYDTKPMQETMAAAHDTVDVLGILAHGVKDTAQAVVAESKKSGKAANDGADAIGKQTDAVKKLQQAYRDMTDGANKDDRSRLQSLNKQLGLVEEIAVQYTKGIPGATPFDQLAASRQQAITRSTLEGAPDLREQSQTEKLTAWYEKRRKLLKQELDQEIITTREYQRAMEALEKSYNANRLALQKKAQEKQAEETKRSQEEAKRQAAQHIEDIKRTYQSLAQSLETDDEKRLRTLKEQLAVIKEMSQQAAKGMPGGASSDDLAKTRKRTIDKAVFEGMPEIAGAGPFAEIDQQKEQLEKWYQEKQDMLDTALEQESITRQEYNDRNIALSGQYNNRELTLQQRHSDLMLQSGESLFGNLADAAKQFAGENSGIYRALFAIEKAFGIARSIIAIQTGIAEAAANPFPANLAAMASVAAATASIVSTIASVTMPSGMAHEGIDKVPKSGTWLLEKGERVTTANTSNKLDRTLEQLRNNANRNAANIAITVNVNGSGDEDPENREQQGTQLGRALETAVRQVLIRERRPGGMLS